ncbi:MAG: 4Fe-4S dicluster domain-containing protein [Thermoleophilia bacterium]
MGAPVKTLNLDVMAVMDRDLRRALTKPAEKRRWSMVIDLQRCIGCEACTVACKAENKTPPGVAYNVVIEEEVGTYPNVRRRFLPRPCMQCAKPPCVTVCPVSATYRRPDGVVVIDYEECIGCRYCLNACPYGARYFDSGEFYTEGTPRVEQYEQTVTRDVADELGREWRRVAGKESSSPVGNARKCHYCLHRLENGALPACVVTCLGRARYFGDLSDPESLVAKLVADERVGRLKEELGTEPQTYYLF